MGGKYFPQNPSPSKPWYEAEGGARLQADTVLVAQCYSSLKFVIDAERKRARLEGPMHLLHDCGITNSVNTRIEFPRTYPADEPLAYDADGRFKALPGASLADRHLIAGGRCCLWLSPRSKWEADDPSALGTFLDELAVFWDRQFIYEDTKRWPGGQYQHGRDGFVEFFEEELGDRDLTKLLLPIITGEIGIGRNDLCPCESGKKYKRCHQTAVESIQRRTGFANFAYFFGRNVAERKGESNAAEG